jgi:hypothetical protein
LPAAVIPLHVTPEVIATQLLYRLWRSTETDGEEIVDHAQAFSVHPSREFFKLFTVSITALQPSSGMTTALRNRIASSFTARAQLHYKQVHLT